MKKIALSLLAASLCFTARAASDSWNVDADGNYTDTANWLGGVVPGADNGTSSTDTADFSYALTATRTVTLPGIYALGTIAFGNTSTNNYLITGSTLRLNNNAVIESLAGTGKHIDEIASTINLRGLGNSVITIRNNSTEAGLKISGNINSTVAEGKVITLVLDGSNTKSGIGTTAINNTISGVIGDDADGDVAMIKNGGGLWTLTGNNLFEGGLTFNAGTLRYFGGGTAFGLGTINIASNGVTFNHANSGAMTLANNMSVNGDFTLAGGSNTIWSGNWDLNGGTRTLTVDADSTISGVISNGAFTKAGGKALFLTGANSHTGDTTVSAGTLVVNGSLAGGLIVDAAATLGGGGTISGATTISGIHTPGNSPGLQMFESDLTYNDGSSVTWELTSNALGVRGTDYDGIDVGGDLTINDTSTINLVFNGTGSAVDWADAFWDSDHSWTFYDVAGSLTGLFTLGTVSKDINGADTMGAFSISAAGSDVMINYVAAIPEPAVISLMTLVGAGVFIRRIRVR